MEETQAFTNKTMNAQIMAFEKKVELSLQVGGLLSLLLYRRQCDSVTSRKINAPSIRCHTVIGKAMTRPPYMFLFEDSINTHEIVIE